MDAGSFRFGVGEFACVSVSGGALNYPPETHFSRVPMERVEEALRHLDLPTSQVMTPYTSTGLHPPKAVEGNPRRFAFFPRVYATSRTLTVPYLSRHTTKRRPVVGIDVGRGRSGGDSIAHWYPRAE